MSAMKDLYLRQMGPSGAYEPYVWIDDEVYAVCPTEYPKIAQALDSAGLDSALVYDYDSPTDRVLTTLGGCVEIWGRQRVGDDGVLREYDEGSDAYWPLGDDR